MEVCRITRSPTSKSRVEILYDLRKIREYNQAEFFCARLNFLIQNKKHFAKHYIKFDHNMSSDAFIRTKNIGTVYKTLKIILDATTQSLRDRLLKESINKFDIMHNLTFILSRIQILHQSNIPYGFINELYITDDFKLQPLPLLYDIPAIFINSSRMELLTVPMHNFSLSHDIFDLGKLIYSLSNQGKLIYNNLENNFISGAPFLIKELMNKDECQRPKLNDELIRRILYYFENR